MPLYRTGPGFHDRDAERGTRATFGGMTAPPLAALVVAAALACSPSPRPVDSTSDTPTSPPTAAAVPTPAPTATATAAPTSTPTATPTPTPGQPPPPPPPPPPVRSAVALEPSGTTPLAAGGETVVDPASTFEIELVPRLADARIVLVDAADAHVAAKDVRELAATTRLTLAPEAPLVPGSRYVLRADGASQREMHDADGHPFAPVGFAILVAGTPPPPAPKRPPKRRHRR